jgi:hypothetical protein
MVQIFGSFIESFPPDRDSLELIFTPTSERIKNLWKNQRLSAHFAADYFANFLPIGSLSPEADEQRIKEAKGAVSYVANELLENAMKFNSGDGKFKVKFGIQFLNQSDVVAVLFATNSVNVQKAQKFQEFIQELLASDPEEFYVQQIEASAEQENAEMSGLGFLTMINDYNATLGWKFETLQAEPEILTVTTMAQVPV